MKGMLRMRSLMLWGVLCAGLLGGACLRVAAQAANGIPGLIYNQPDNYTTWINAVGRASVGTGAGAEFGTWQFGSSSGDPLLTDDDNIRLIKLASAFIFLADQKKEVQVGTGGRILSWPDENALVQTHQTSFSWSTADPLDDITVICTLHLVRDVLTWSYVIKNNGSQPKQVGFRVVEDVQFPPNETLFLGKNQAPAVVNESPYYTPGGGVINTATEMKGGAVPSEWWVQYPSIPTVDNNFRPTWKGLQKLAGTYTIPERVVFADLTDVTGYTMEVIADASLPANANQAPTVTWGAALTQDTGVGLYYPTMLLGSNGTRTINGEVQMNWSEVNTFDVYGLAVACPTWVGYRSGDDPATGAVENGYYSPSVLNLRAYVSCDSTQKSPDVAVSISLGTGLELVPGQVTNYSAHLDGIANTMVSKSPTDQMSWMIRPNRQAAGLIPVTVTATFITGGGDATSSGGGITNTIYVNVPALSEYTYPGGIIPNTTDAMKYLTGFPFTFATKDAKTALGLGNGVDLAWYDSTIKDYRYASSDTVNIMPGRAYWLRMPSTTKVVLQNATPVNQRNNYTVTLQRGWNAISNPYQFGIEWGMCRVEYASTQYALIDAVNMGLIRPEIWSWNPNNGIYSPPTNPSPNNDLYAELKPFSGYWVYCTDTVSLVFMPNTFVPAMDSNLPDARSARAVSGNSWRVNVQTDADGVKDPLATFGVDPAAATDSWTLNLMKPPLSPGGISSYFAHPNEGRASGDYAVDLRAPSTTLSWPLTVNCPRANASVTLSWPDLTQVPSRTALILTDTLTGQQTFMRTAANYRFNSGTGGVRNFTITTDSSYARLQFTQTQVRKPRGTGIVFSYAVSAPATVTLRVRGVTGRLVRTLDGGRAAGGANDLPWDGRDAAGKLVPAGLYLCELSAEAVNGQRARTTLTVPMR